MASGFGIIGASIEISGVLMDELDVSLVNTIMTASFNGTSIQARIEDAGAIVASSSYLIAKMERDGQHNGVETYLITLIATQSAV